MPGRWWWAMAWVLATLAGAAMLASSEWVRQRELFETDARIVHRLLSQRVVQHDAILATLSLLQPGRDGADADAPERRLPALYPQILSVQSLQPGATWPTVALQTAEIRSRTLQRAALGATDLAAGRYQLVLAAQPESYALDIDMRAMVPWSDWPHAPESSPVRVALELNGHSFVLQPGREAASLWRFDFHKHLAAESQPFNVQASRTLDWAFWPWGWMTAWALACAAALVALRHLQGQRAQRQRAEELLRLGQVTRLNTLGELAAGMAHELNQPLTAILASTQAASRLLDEDPPELTTARGAMTQAAAQARRASDVIQRMRRLVERPDLAGQTQAVNLADAASRALYLLQPECERRGVKPNLQASQPVTVLADAIALDQIVHNLLMNALQALEQSPADNRTLSVTVKSEDGKGELLVADSGPGITDDVLPRLFEPFFSTRDGGLGLGLSLSETLATQMGGALSAFNRKPQGAAFCLKLPLTTQP
ncbi:MAG: two-component sensor histidine kinase [Burkholderiaceae bacterium]|nr:two-component sensor histidine kinase [Burkholderiaceae bacterium]